MPKSSGAKTILRQWKMLTMLPSRPPGRTAKELQSALSDEGFSVGERTVQRDLADLYDSQVFPIEKSIGHPSGWYWRKGSSLRTVPATSPVEAVSLVLAGDLLKQLLPASLSRFVEGRLAASKKLLDTIPDNRITAWSQLVRYMPLGQSLIPPRLDADVLSAVEKALIHGLQLKVMYRPMRKKEPMEWVMHPLAILVHGVSPYLVMSSGRGTKIMQLPIHRFIRAEVMKEESWRPSKFTLESHVASGEAGFGASGVIQLRARILPALAQQLSETPLTEEQDISEKNGQFFLRAKVMNSWDLEFWILSQANRMTILEPVELRNKIKGFLASTLSTYEP